MATRDDNSATRLARQELADILGGESVLGFHIDFMGRSTAQWDYAGRGDGTRFPCIDSMNRYTGCLGRECRAITCWSGPLVTSAYHARLSQPLPMFELKGCTCPTCEHVMEVETPSGRTMLDCGRGHFERPVTGACLVRKRVPDSVPVPCPDYAESGTLRPEVAEFRDKQRSRARRG